MPQDPNQLGESLLSLDDYERQLAEKYGVPLAIAKAVRGLESSNQQVDPKTGDVLTSWKNARGRYQVLPDTAKGIDASADPNDIFDNTYLGIKYLAQGYQEAQKFKDIEPDALWGAALVHYHGGPGGLKHAYNTGNFRSDAKPGKPETGMSSYNYAKKILASAHKMMAQEQGADATQQQPAQPAAPAPTWASPHQQQQQQAQQQAQAQAPPPAAPQQQWQPGTGQIAAPRPQEPPSFMDKLTATIFGTGPASLHARPQAPQVQQQQPQAQPPAPRTEQERQQLLKQLKDEIVVPSVVLPAQREAWKQQEFDRRMQAGKEAANQQKYGGLFELGQSRPDTVPFRRMVQPGDTQSQHQVDNEVRQQAAKRLMVTQDPNEREKLLQVEQQIQGTGTDRLRSNISQGFSTMGRSRLLGAANKVLNYWGSSEDIARTNADIESRQRALEAEYYLTAAADPSLSGDVTRAIGTVASDMAVIAPLAAITGGIGGAAGLSGTLAGVGASGIGSMGGTALLSNWKQDPWGSLIETAVSPFEMGAGAIGRAMAKPVVGRLTSPALKWAADRAVGTLAGGAMGALSETAQEVPSTLYSVLKGDTDMRQAGRNFAVSAITGGVMGNFGGGLSPEHLHATGGAPGPIPVPSIPMPPGIAAPVGPSPLGPAPARPQMPGFMRPQPAPVTAPAAAPASSPRLEKAQNMVTHLEAAVAKAPPESNEAATFTELLDNWRTELDEATKEAAPAAQPPPAAVSTGPDFIRTPGTSAATPTPTQPQVRRGDNDVPDIEPETIDSVLPPEQRVISDAVTPRDPDPRHGGDIASQARKDLPWFNDASHSILLDPDFRASLRRNLEDMRARGIIPLDNNDNEITPQDVADLTDRVPWNIRPGEPGYTPEVAAARKDGINKGFRRAHAAFRATMRERLGVAGFDIRSLDQLRASDWVDYFNENIPQQSRAWQKLRHVLEGEGIDWPTNAKTHGFPSRGRGGLHGIPAHLDISEELNEATAGVPPRTQAAKTIQALVGNDEQFADKFADIYAKTARTAASGAARGQNYSHLPANLKDISKDSLVALAAKEAQPIFTKMAYDRAAPKAEARTKAQQQSAAKAKTVAADIAGATTAPGKKVRIRKQREAAAPTPAPTTTPTAGTTPVTRPDMSGNQHFDFDAGKSQFMDAFKPKPKPGGRASRRPGKPKVAEALPEPDFHQMMNGLYQMAGALAEAGKRNFAEFSEAIRTEAGPYADYIAEHIPLVYKSVRAFGAKREWGGMSTDQEIEAHLAPKPVIAKVRSAAAVKAEQGKATKAEKAPTTPAAVSATARSKKSIERATAVLARVMSFTGHVAEGTDIVPDAETLAKLPTDRMRDLRKETLNELQQSRQVLDEEQRGAGGDTSELERYIANLEETVTALDKRLNIDSMREGRPPETTTPKTQKQRIVSYVKKKADRAERTAAPAAAVVTEAPEPKTLAEIDARMEELEEKQEEQRVRMGKLTGKEQAFARAIYNSMQAELERLSARAAELDTGTPPPAKVPVKATTPTPTPAATTPAVTKPKETKPKKKAPKPTAVSVEADRQVISLIEAGNTDIISLIRAAVDEGQNIPDAVVAALEKAEGKQPAVTPDVTPIDEGGPLTIEDQIAALKDQVMQLHEQQERPGVSKRREREIQKDIIAANSEIKRLSHVQLGIPSPTTGTTTTPANLPLTTTTTPEAAAVTPTVTPAATPTVKKPGGIISPRGQYVRPETRIVRAPKDVPLPRRQRPTATPEQIDALNQELKAATEKRLQLAEEGKTVGRGLGWEEAVKLKAEHRQKLTAAKAEEARLATAIGAAQGIIGATPTSTVEITKTATKPPPAEAVAAEPALPSRRTEPVSEEERAAGRVRLTQLEIEQMRLVGVGNRLSQKLDAQVKKQEGGDTSEQLAKDIAFSRSQVRSNARLLNDAHLEAQRVALSTGAPPPAAPGRVIEEGTAKGEMSREDREAARVAREMQEAFVKATNEKEANDRAQAQAAAVIERLKQEEAGEHPIGPTGEKEKQTRIEKQIEKNARTAAIADAAHDRGKSLLNKLKKKPSGRASRRPEAEATPTTPEPETTAEVDAQERESWIRGALDNLGYSYAIKGLRGYTGWSSLINAELKAELGDEMAAEFQPYIREAYTKLRDVTFKKDKKGGFTSDAEIDTAPSLTETAAAEGIMARIRDKMQKITQPDIDWLDLQEDVDEVATNIQRAEYAQKLKEDEQRLQGKFKALELETTHKTISGIYKPGEATTDLRGQAQGWAVKVTKYPPFRRITEITEKKLEILLRRGEISEGQLRRLYLEAWRKGELAMSEQTPEATKKLIESLEQAEYEDLNPTQRIATPDEEVEGIQSFAIKDEAESMSNKRLLAAEKEATETILQQSKNAPSAIKRKLHHQFLVEKVAAYLNRRGMAEVLGKTQREMFPDLKPGEEFRPQDPFRSEMAPLAKTKFEDLPVTQQAILSMHRNNVVKWNNELAENLRAAEEIDKKIAETNVDEDKSLYLDEDETIYLETARQRLGLAEQVLRAQIEEGRKQIANSSYVPGKEKGKAGRPAAHAVLEKTAMREADILGLEAQEGEEVTAEPVTKEDAADYVLSNLKDEAALSTQQELEMASREQRTQSDIDKGLMSRFAETRKVAVERLRNLREFMERRQTYIEDLVERLRKEGATEEGLQPFIQGIHALSVRAFELEVKAREMQTGEKPLKPKQPKKKSGRRSMLPEEAAGIETTQADLDALQKEIDESFKAIEDLISKLPDYETHPVIPTSPAHAAKIIQDSVWILKAPARTHLIPRLWTNTQGMTLIAGLNRQRADNIGGITFEFHEVQRDLLDGIDKLLTTETDTRVQSKLKTIKRHIQTAMFTARERGYNSIIFMDRESGKQWGAQELRTTGRHEATHAWQMKHARPKGREAGMLSDATIASLPHNGLIRQALQRLGYEDLSLDNIAAEGMAHIMAGQEGWLGLDTAQAAKWLTGIMAHIQSEYGDAALDDLIKTVPTSRPAFIGEIIRNAREQGRDITARGTAAGTQTNAAAQATLRRGGDNQPGTGRASISPGRGEGRAGTTEAAEEGKGPGTRVTQQQATAKMVRSVFPRTNWGTDVPPSAAASLPATQARADFRPAAQLASLGVQAIEGNEAMTQIVGSALKDLGYEGKWDAVGFPKVFLNSIGSQLRHYGEKGVALADHLDSIRKSPMYGDRVAYFNTSRQVSSDKLYNAVIQEFGNQFLSDVTGGKISPWDGTFIAGDKAYDHMRAGVAKLLGDPDVTDTVVEKTVPGLILAGNWKDLGFKTQAQAVTFLKRYARQLATDYGLDGLKRWPLSQPSTQADTLSTIIGEVQSERQKATTQTKKSSTQPAKVSTPAPAGSAGTAVLPGGGTAVPGTRATGGGPGGGGVVPAGPATTPAPAPAATAAGAGAAGGHTVAAGHAGGVGPVPAAAPIPAGHPGAPPVVAALVPPAPAPGTPAHGIFMRLAKRIFFPGGIATPTQIQSMAGGGLGQGSGASPRGSKTAQKVNVAQQASMLVSTGFMLGNLGTVVGSTGFEVLVNSPAAAITDAILSLGRVSHRVYERRTFKDFSAALKLFKENESLAPAGYRLIGFNLSETLGGARQAGLATGAAPVLGVGLPTYLVPAFERIPPAIFTNKIVGTATEKALFLINQYPDMVGFTMHFFANAQANIRLLEKQSRASGIALTPEDYQMALADSHIEAEYQSLRHANKFSGALRMMKDGIGRLGEVVTGKPSPAQIEKRFRRSSLHLGDFFGNVKFTQVPGAMAHHAWNKSPLGLMRAASLGLKSMTASRLGDPMARYYQSQAIRATTEALGGTAALMAPYFVLGFLGLTVPAPKDYEEEEVLRSTGKTPYGVNYGRTWKLIASGFDSRELEWQDDDVVRRHSQYVSPHGIAQDIASELGHAVRRQMQKGKEPGLWGWGGAIWNPLLDALDNFGELTAGSRAFSDIKKAIRENEGPAVLGAMVQSMVDNMLGSVVNIALLGQTAPIFDRTRREYRHGGEKGSFTGKLSEYVRKPLTRVPGVSRNFEARLNVLGEEMEHYPNATTMDILLPGKTTRYKGDTLKEAMLDLHAAPNYLRQKEGETADSLRSRLKERGDRIKNYGGQLMISGVWGDASTDDQVYLLKELYERAADPDAKLTVSVLRESLKAHHRQERERAKE